MVEILIAFDGSDAALRALRYAISQAKEHSRMRLHIVFVHEAQIFIGSATADGTDTSLGNAFREHINALLRPATEVAEAAGVAFTSSALIGETAKCITRRAEELKCSSIVMGTRGMTALGNLILGSVATQVIHLASVPVTLVK